MDARKMRDAESSGGPGAAVAEPLVLAGPDPAQPTGVCGDPSGPLLSPVSPSAVGFFQLVMKIPLPLQTLPPPDVLGGIWG